jgi:hypothetical protein
MSGKLWTRGERFRTGGKVSAVPFWLHHPQIPFRKGLPHCQQSATVSNKANSFFTFPLGLESGGFNRPSYGHNPGEQKSYTHTKQHTYDILKSHFPYFPGVHEYRPPAQCRAPDHLPRWFNVSTIAAI